ncbi:sugar ABC transporter substrate-binding protein [Paenibacillus xanthanilyticus]|uniref:Extracellular solute-binding protein n=1 Tax=Paenibacillus xanthanilyticus TaxID=1783531 RepID=A0ABV8K5T8_9BACL
MMKKTGVLISAMAMTLALSACSGGSAENGGNGGGNKAAPASAEQPVDGQANAAGSDELVPEPGAKLIIWEAKEQQAFLEEMGKQFTTKYGVPVEFQEVGGGDQRNRLTTDGPAGIGADILAIPHDQLVEAVAAGLFLPNDFYAEETKTNFLPAAVEAVTIDGVLYGYPRNMETYLLYYNKSLVKPEDLANWDSIKAFSQKFNEPKNNKFGFMFLANDLYFVNAFANGYGGYIFGQNGTDPTDIGINKSEFVEGMKFYQSLQDILPIKATDATADVKTNLFQTGKLAINMDGIWQLGNFTSEKLGFEVGAVTLPPMPNGKSPQPYAGVKSYFVSSFSQYPNAAKLFIQMLTSEEALSKEFEMTGIIPARNGMEDDPAIRKNEVASTFLEQFKTAQTMPGIIEMRAVWTPVTAALEPIWNGADVQQTMDKAAADLKIAIEQQGN